MIGPELLLALLMSLRGNVFLYQGEELGLPQAKFPLIDLRDPEAIANWPLTQGRDGARTPMPWTQGAPYAGFSTAEPWLPIPEEHAQRAVSVQNGQADFGPDAHARTDRTAPVQFRLARGHLAGAAAARTAVGI